MLVIQLQNFSQTVAVLRLATLLLVSSEAAFKAKSEVASSTLEGTKAIAEEEERAWVFKGVGAVKASA